MFPSKAYRELCTQPEVADRLREEWEPKFGDWAIAQYSGDLLLIVDAREHSLDMVPMSWEGWEEGMIHTGLQKHLIPLFQPRQIIEMLEERGYNWSIEYDQGEPGDKQHRALAWRPFSNEAAAEAISPDPETALLGAWLEVVKDEA